MAWQTPKINWRSPAYPDWRDYNRMEGNILDLKKAVTIDIADAGRYFTLMNLEAALAELYQLCR
mgnify:CR=1 FL=1